jgi:Domain of unknown function (DUF1918)
MTVRVGDEIMILTRDLHRPVREGQIREVRHDLDGVVYLVQWSDTGGESMLPHGPNVVIKHRHPGDTAAVTPRLARLRHPLEWLHNRDLERRQQAGYEQLARRVEEIIVGLDLVQSDFSIAAGRVFHAPEVVSVDPGPPVGLDIRMLPGQSPKDFSKHAAAIAYDLGMAEVRVVPLGPSVIRLELLPHAPLAGSLSR